MYFDFNIETLYISKLDDGIFETLCLQEGRIFIIKL